MTDESLVIAYLDAQSRKDVEALRALVTDDVELYGRKGLAAQGVDAFLENASGEYDHLDDVFTLVHLDGDQADVRRELVWRETREATAWRTQSMRFVERDGKLERVELLYAAPWERA